MTWAIISAAGEVLRKGYETFGEARRALALARAGDRNSVTAYTYATVELVDA